jgi:tRNA(Phe) wybutosine-synthesizing methylase Tyw3
MTKFKVERPQILKKLYKINAANNDLLTTPSGSGRVKS